MKGIGAMLKDIMTNLLIAGGVWKVHDWLTKPKWKPIRRSTDPDMEKSLIGCAIFILAIFAIFMICVIYMAVTDLPCFR